MPVIINPPSPQNQHVRSTVTFVAGTTGTVAAHTLFTITGRVIVRLIVGVCTSDVTSGGSATLTLGVTGAATTFIGSTTATGIATATPIWMSTTPTAGALAVPAACMDTTVTSNVIYTVGTAALTGGTIVFDCWYDALTDDGALA